MMYHVMVKRPLEGNEGLETTNCVEVQGSEKIEDKGAAPRGLNV